MQVPLVDGNVIRVFSRVRGIAMHPKHKAGLQLIWALGAATVKGERPGDFNQVL
jgi:A/G-specific adenine glycosylase